MTPGVEEWLFLAPVALLPLGVIVLVRARETVTWVGGGGMVYVGAAWILALWQLAHCDEAGDSCGVPNWLGAIVAGGFVVAVGGIVVAGLVIVSRRFRRGRHTPAR